MAILAPSSSRSGLLRRALAAGSTTIRTAFTPAVLVVEPTSQTAATDKPVSCKLPAVETIEAAALAYEQAAEAGRRADRDKRRARKILDLLPAGRFGSWNLERTPSSRETPDLDAIRATYTLMDLGEIPMKQCAPSLKVSRIAA